MKAVQAMTESAVAQVEHGHDEHGHDEHGHHPSWLAHHFDDAEQQFDSGKLGMWLFLVTEVLFFSGMFCAYALLRSHNPDVFNYCSSFLNEKLGAINTGVLLFSSLTMAWAVRAAQLSQHRLLVALLGITLGCAAVFLGVKTVEYSHKWSIGLLPGKLYVSQVEHPAHHPWYETALPYLQAPGVILAALFAVWFVYSWGRKNRVHMEVAGPLFLAAICYIGGAALGLKLEEAPHDEPAVAQVSEAAAAPATETPAAQVAPVVATLPNIDANRSPDQSHPDQVQVTVGEDLVPMPSVNQKGKAGLFFSVYYCMTGVHALHILGGMLVISWLIYKAANEEFHSKYFGPVDNVGLYWHLVDFIWIYLFPLLYLIT